MLRTFFIRTFGCQMNEHDSGRMEQLLTVAGLKRVASPKEADLVIINSCSVRAKPEHKALSEVGRYRKARHARGARIILAGCVAQQEGARLLERAPYLDAVLGPDAIGQLPEVVAEIQAGRGPVLAVEMHNPDDPRFVQLCQGNRSEIAAPVTIMKGCNNFCSYCVVPYVRGREVSRPLGDLLAEVEMLAGRGCREVVLLGQNVNSYCDPHGVTFGALLEALEKQAAVSRIRFTTSHPKDLGPDLIALLASLERVCEHVHLALQAGSNRILERMNRGYSREQFIEKALRLRAAVPGVSITTDIIVGFPGETEQDFRDTLGVVESVAFDLAYSFKYSPRPQTRAASWPDDVAPDVKTRRLSELQATLSRIESASLARMVGTVSEVLLEGRSARDSGIWTGRTRCNRVVNFQAEHALEPGSLLPVEIRDSRGHTLWGASVLKQG